jgi:hypothetical protein
MAVLNEAGNNPSQDGWPLFNTAFFYDFVRKTYPVSAERGAADDIARTSLKRLSRPGLRPLTAVNV